jgi:hypothetical protein
MINRVNTPAVKTLGGIALILGVGLGAYVAFHQNGEAFPRVQDGQEIGAVAASTTPASGVVQSKEAPAQQTAAKPTNGVEGYASGEGRGFCH